MHEAGGPTRLLQGGGRNYISRRCSEHRAKPRKREERGRRSGSGRGLRGEGSGREVGEWRGRSIVSFPEFRFEAGWFCRTWTHLTDK